MRFADFVRIFRVACQLVFECFILGPVTQAFVRLKLAFGPIVSDWEPPIVHFTCLYCLSNGVGIRTLQTKTQLIAWNVSLSMLSCPLIYSTIGSAILANLTQFLNWVGIHRPFSLNIARQPENG